MVVVKFYTYKVKEDHKCPTYCVCECDEHECKHVYVLNRLTIKFNYPIEKNNTWQFTIESNTEYDGEKYPDESKIPLNENAKVFSIKNIHQEISAEELRVFKPHLSFLCKFFRVKHLIDDLKAKTLAEKKLIKKKTMLEEKQFIKEISKIKKHYQLQSSICIILMMAAWILLIARII